MWVRGAFRPPVPSQAFTVCHSAFIHRVELISSIIGLTSSRFVRSSRASSIRAVAAFVTISSTGELCRNAPFVKVATSDYLVITIVDASVAFLANCDRFHEIPFVISLVTHIRFAASNAASREAWLEYVS